MVSAGRAACVLALVWACCCFSSSEGTWDDVDQETAVHVEAKHQGVWKKQRQEDTQTLGQEFSTWHKVKPQRQWKALQFLLEKAKRKLPAPLLTPKAASPAHDLQGDEPWLEPKPWFQAPVKYQRQRQAPSAVKPNWVSWKPTMSQPSKGTSHHGAKKGFPELEFDDVSANPPLMPTGFPATASGKRTPSPKPVNADIDVNSSGELEQSSQSAELPTDEAHQAPESISALCGDSFLQLEVKRDFFGIGQLISPLDIVLGDCEPTGLNESSETLLFETELHKCGSAVEMTDSLLVYKFALSYMPSKHASARLPSAVVNVSCQYQRWLNVSSSGLMPAFQSFSGVNISRGILDFSLKIMNDDWTAERASSKYFLGESINVEAAVHQHGHEPFHVFVEECVASPEMGDGAEPAYYIIEKDGCLMESRLEESRSRFMPVTQDGALRFQLEAFKFAGISGDKIYLTCTLKAVLASDGDHAHKACHFSEEMDMWVNANGPDELCGCCEEGTCQHRVARSVEGYRKRAVVLGPIHVHTRI